MDLDWVKKRAALFFASTLQTKATYAASGTTGIISVLTFNQVVGAIGVVFSVIIAAFTAWSNHKKNQKEMQLVDFRLSVRAMKHQDDQANGR